VSSIEQEQAVAPRAYWKGYLKLSLVSCPVALFPASSEREKIRFHQINKTTGNRIKYRKVDAETEEDVETSDIVKGYEVGKGEYIELEPEELEAVAVESTRTLEIDVFVPKKEIDELYLNNPYYIVPDGDVGQQAFAVIREAIRKEGMVALGESSSHRASTSLQSSRAAKGCSAPRCATRMKSARRSNISTRSRTKKSRRTCWSSQPTSSRRSPGTSIRKNSRTITKKH
jgi:hypothetical protein